MKKSLQIYLILLIIPISLFSQKKEFTLNLEGKKYEKIEVVVATDSMRNIPLDVVAVDSSTWRFSIPNEIYEKAFYIQIKPVVEKKMSGRLYSMMFAYVDGCDTLKTASSLFSLDNQMLKARFGRTIQCDNCIPVDVGGKEVMMSYTSDIFLIDNLELDSDLYVKMKYPYIDRLIEGEKYEDYILRYSNLVEKYRNSEYLLKNLWSKMRGYQSKNDIEQVYNSFSDSRKNSYYGLIIKDYISKRFDTGYLFENIELPTIDPSKTEKIILDKTKPALLILSASWCGPCHKLVPVLKEIYDDLKENMNMVYLSIDEPATRSAWWKFVEKENILWRSLILGDDKEFKTKYDISPIPDALLVLPNGNARRVDLQSEDERNMLYELRNN